MATRGVPIFIVGVLAAALGCESRLAVGASCALTSDCPAPLTCLAGRCRSACRDFRDCAYPLECVGVGGDVLGCRVAEDGACRGAADCQPPLECIGGACEQPCTHSIDCAPGLVCDPDRCAQPPLLTTAGTCDPTSALTGCPAGTRCSLGSGRFTCIEAASSLPPPDGVGEPCTGACADGLLCAGGRCVRTCRVPTAGCSDPSCTGTSCGTDRYCAPDAIGMPDGSLPPALPDGLGYCSEACDPHGDAATDGCPTGTACAVAVPRGRFVLWCRPLDMPALAPYADCAVDAWDCPLGTVCEVAGADPDRLCRPFCHPGGSDCPDGRPCVTVPDLDGIGVCGDVP